MSIAAQTGERTGATTAGTGETTAGTAASESSCAQPNAGHALRRIGALKTPNLMESEIYMRDRSSRAEDTKSAVPSPLRLRVGVFLILLWIIPFWLLAEPIAHSLSGLSKPPSVAAVTTAIVAVQTVLGLLGFWVAGAAVKSIIKGSTMRHSLVAIWSMLIHGDIRGQGEVVDAPNEGDPKEVRPPREDA